MAIPHLPSNVPDTELLRAANALHSAAIRLLRRTRHVDRETGLTPERLSLLSILVYGGVRTVGDLAEAEQVSNPAISRILSSLEGDGYVSRERSPEDRRVVLVSATMKARELMERARARRLESIARELSALDGESLDALYRAGRLVEALGAP